MPKIAIEIETIAARNTDLFKSIFVERFKLDIDPTRLSALSYHQFLGCPEMAAYRIKVGEEPFHSHIAEVEQDVRMFLHATARPYAQRSVQALAARVSLSYSTLRTHQSLERFQQIQQATQQWLIDQQFPNPEHITFSHDLLGALIEFYHQHEQQQEPLVFVSKRCRMYLRDFSLLYQRGQDTVANAIKKRLTFVAFGTERIDPALTNGLQMVTLPSWDRVSDRESRLFIS